MRSIEQSVAGRQQNVFLLGERGVGKTSVASLLRHWAYTKHQVVGAHVFLGGVRSLPELVRRIFDSLLKVTHTEKWFDKVRSLFGNIITDVGLFGVSVGFAPADRDLDQLLRQFPQSMHQIVLSLHDDVKGLLIILDDLDAISAEPDFANWYKSFVDEVATHFERYPVTVLLIGLPEIVDSLAALQPSLPRIFTIIELQRLSNDEVTDFLQKAFAKVNLPVDADAMDLMVRFSSGVPVIMHEIGDATYWGNADEKIDHRDGLVGVISAAGRIGRKYLDPQVYRAIRSKSYRSILRKLALGERALDRNFTRREVAQHLTEREKRVFDNFLRRLRQLGVIELDRESGTGCYRFVNDIFPVYVYMEATRSVEETKPANT